MKRSTTRFLKWAGITVLVLGVVYAVMLGLSSRALRRAYAALEADGRPMTLEQVIPAPIPDEDNAALIYKSVVLQLKAEKAGEQNLFSELGDCAEKLLVASPNLEDIQQFRTLAESKTVTDALELFERGTKKKGYWNDLDYSMGYALLLPHINSMMSLSRILCATARLQAVDGNHVAAWDTVLAALRFADALRNEPLVVSQVVRMLQVSIVADSIQNIGMDSPPSDIQYQEVQTLLKSFEDTAPLVNAFDGERLLGGEWTFNLPRTEIKKAQSIMGDQDGFFLALSAVSIFKPLLQKDHAVYLNFTRIATKNIGEPYSSNNAELADNVWKSVPRYCVITHMISSAWLRQKQRLNAVTAKARVTRAGLAALRYRQKNGRYPATLEALNVPDLLDPFTGKPLIYSADASGFTVYSIGWNLVDDHGTTSEKRGEGDIVWRYSGSTE